MNIWRMKLRAGNYGDDMWPLCRARDIASMTHPPIYNVDLTNLDKEDVDQDVKTAARSSIWRFAWDIVGGDMILVGDSFKKSIIARGFVKGTPGKRAYRYNDKSPIVEPNNPLLAWKHEVPVMWDNDFVEFPYRDGGPRITVMRYSAEWGLPGTASQPNEQRNNSERPLLNHDGYVRETAASQTNILRLHSTLSNRFRVWLKRKFGIMATQELGQVDLQFAHKGKTYLAELKICYGQDTKRAIRDALGQVFEYNLYPPRQEMTCWLIVLDHSPNVSDRQYFDLLRKRFNLPLTLLWEDQGTFSWDSTFL